MIQILIWSCSDPPQVPWTSCISLLRSQPQRSVSSLWHWNINQDGNKLGLSSWRLNEWGTISQEISDSWVTRLSPVHHIPTPSPLNIYINLLTVIMPVPHIFPSGEFCQGAWSSEDSQWAHPVRCAGARRENHGCFGGSHTTGAFQVVQEEPLCNDDEFLYSMARRRWFCDGSCG